MPHGNRNKNPTKFSTKSGHVDIHDQALFYMIRAPSSLCDCIKRLKRCFERKAHGRRKKTGETFFARLPLPYDPRNLSCKQCLWSRHGNTTRTNLETKSTSSRRQRDFRRMLRATPDRTRSVQCDKMEQSYWTKTDTRKS